MHVYFVLLTLSTSLDVFLNILSQLWPPVVLCYQIPCPIDARVSIGQYIMVSLDDLAFVWSSSCDYLADTFPPFSINLLEIMGSHPLFYYPFILLWQFCGYVRYSSSSNKYLLWKYHNILVIFFALVIVWSPR